MLEADKKLLKFGTQADNTAKQLSTTLRKYKNYLVASDTVLQQNKVYKDDNKCQKTQHEGIQQQQQKCKLILFANTVINPTTQSPTAANHTNNSEYITYLILATFAWKLIKIYSIRYYII